jgi:hypothetical protein
MTDDQDVTEVVATFLRARPTLGTPVGADNQCRMATDELCEALCQRGVAAVPVWVRSHSSMPTEARPRALTADRHRLVRLRDGTFLDVTRRQFEPSAPHPTYYVSEAELARHWREINRGPVDGTLEDEDWQSLSDV